jgi:sugar phosphate isomerase/epimerase
MRNRLVAWPGEPAERSLVHLRDGEAGYIHHSIGNGDVDFADTAAALAEIGYTGKFSLELETRDIENDERPPSRPQGGALLRLPRLGACRP